MSLNVMRHYNFKLGSIMNTCQMRSEKKKFGNLNRNVSLPVFVTDLLREMDSSEVTSTSAVCKKKNISL